MWLPSTSQEFNSLCPRSAREVRYLTRPHKPRKLGSIPMSASKRRDSKSHPQRCYRRMSTARATLACLHVEMDIMYPSEGYDPSSSLGGDVRGGKDDHLVSTRLISPTTLSSSQTYSAPFDPEVGVAPGIQDAPQPLRFWHLGGPRVCIFFARNHMLQ